MAKKVIDAVFDAALAEIADNADRLFVCSAEPSTYAQASTTYMLAQHTMTEGNGNGDYTIGDGDTSGRKIAVTEQANISVTNSGTATHVVLADSVAQTLKIITTCTSQALTAGNTVTVPTFDYEILDPT